MHIKILGSGCPKCNRLYENACSAVNDAGIDAEVEKIEDINQILQAGVLLTPALMIDDKVVSSGKVLSPAEIATLIK